MQLPLQNFTTLVSNMAAGVQGASTQLVDLTVGSVLRATLESAASVSLWLQWLIVQVLSTTRAATSTGSDLDSFVGDFSLRRLPGVPANGVVTFGRYTAGLATVIPAGALVRTADNSQSFAVVADSGNAAWTAASNGFALAATVGSIDLPVAAVTPGAAGNVQAGAITQLMTAIPGVDTVSNALPTLNGADAESDPALRTRFQTYIDSRSRATPLAIANAITTVRQGLRYTILENQDSSGASHPGNFVVTVDDGSGAPPAALLTAVQAAVDAVRPIGTTYAVVPPVVVPAAVAMTVTVAAPADHAAVAASVVAAVSTWVNALGIGGTLPISRLISLAYGADPSVVNVSAVTVNGGTSDLAPPPNGEVRVTSVAVG